jgi:diguanylate cyclase (GGDEF)-like protein/PAS domain S-box-containing protein
LFNSEKSSAKNEKEFKKNFERIVEASPLSVFITDPAGNIVYVNAKFSEMTGYSAEEVIGQNPRIFKTEFTPPEFFELLWQTIKDGEKWVGEFVNRCKDESIIYVHAEILPLLDKSGEITHYLAFEENITRRKELEYELGEANKQIEERTEELADLKKQLREQAYLDRLTGMFDRTYLTEILPREILRSIRARTNLFVVLIDIDQFRLINEKFGYSVGDEVLKQFANSLSVLLEDVDIACRYGEDEWLLLISGKTDEHGLSRASHIKDHFDSHPIEWASGSIPLTVSIGLVVYPSHGKTTDELLNKAEAALAQAKKMGGNQVAVWEKDS